MEQSKVISVAFLDQNCTHKKTLVTAVYLVYTRDPIMHTTALYLAPRSSIKASMQCRRKALVHFHAQYPI